MESYYTPPWWCQKDEHTLPTWRPCLPPLTVISYLTPHPETLNRQQSWTNMHTLMPALELALLLLLVTGGEPGSSFQAGNQKVETFDGLRLLGLNFSPNSSSVNHQQGTISRSMETTWGLLRDGGKGGVEISKQMQSSAEFTSYHKSTRALYTCDMSQVQKIQQTSPLMESTLPFTCYSHSR